MSTAFYHHETSQELYSVPIHWKSTEPIRTENARTYFRYCIYYVHLKVKTERENSRIWHPEDLTKGSLPGRQNSAAAGKPVDQWLDPQRIAETGLHLVVASFRNMRHRVYLFSLSILIITSFNLFLRQSTTFFCGVNRDHYGQGG